MSPLRSVALVAISLACLPRALSSQTRLVLEEAVIYLDDERLGAVTDPEVAGCVWFSTYNLHGLPATLAGGPESPTDSIATVRLSFFAAGEPAPPMPQRDGMFSRFHNRIVIGSRPLLFHRKSTTPIGWDGEFDWTAPLSDLGELVLSELGIPTRQRDGEPVLREFDGVEIAQMRERFGTVAECYDIVRGKSLVR